MKFLIAIFAFMSSFIITCMNMMFMLTQAAFCLETLRAYRTNIGSISSMSFLERGLKFKGTNQRHFIFEINVGKSRIRHRTTLNLNLQPILVDLEIHHSVTESLYVGSPVSEIDFKNKMAWV